MTSSVRLGVSPTATTPTSFYSQRFRGFVSPLEPWIVQFVSLPRCSPQFICTEMWDHLVHQPPAPVFQPLPCHESSLPSCRSPPLLLVQMNVSSLTPWLLDFHTVRSSGSSGYFFVFKFVVLLLVVRGGTVCLPTPPSWPEVLFQAFDMLL